MTPNQKSEDMSELDLKVWRLVVAPDYEKYRQNMPEGFSPSTNWTQGGPLIEEYEIRSSCHDNKEWWAEIRLDKNGKVAFCTSFDHTVIGRGATPLIAAMKALVASKHKGD